MLTIYKGRLKVFWKGVGLADPFFMGKNLTAAYSKKHSANTQEVGHKISNVKMTTKVVYCTALVFKESGNLFSMAGK